MSQSSFFEPPTDFVQRVQELANRDEKLTTQDARLLLDVELAFTLAEELGFADEPVTVLWALLSGMQLPEIRLQRLTDAQRHALANVRQIVPYGPRFAWQDALQRYQRLPDSLRGYQFDLTASPATLIVNAKKPAAEVHAVHTGIYQQCLTAELRWHRRQIPKPVEAAKKYRFTALAQDAQEQPISATLEVSFEAAALEKLPLPPASWCREPEPKQPFRVSRQQLQRVAEEVDKRESELHEQFGYEPQNWAKRLQKIDLQLVHETGVTPTDTLCIDQFTHIAGMVASGKSTLSMLLAAYLISQEPARRLTLVVGDVQSAIRLANQLNIWFRQDPATEAPVAVPLLGRSTRARQLRGFQSSAEYQQYCKRNQPHWGERWLSPLCPLQAHLPEVEVTQLLAGQLLKTGKEPCQILQRVPEAAVPPGAGQSQRKAPSAASKTKYACPYLPGCPQYQLYRDMPEATVWITTPGAMAASTLPAQLEDRPLKLGELIQEQSDVVIFDEADTIIKWFDDQYAQELRLTGGRKGILDTITLPTEHYTIGARVMPPGMLRWVGAERSSQQAVTSVLTMLHPAHGPGFLHEWVTQHQFTPLSLFYRLARLVAGVPEYDKPATPEEERQQNEQATQGIMQHFKALLEPADPLRPLDASNLAEPVEQLWQLLRGIDSNGESAVDLGVQLACRDWLKAFCPSAGQAGKESLDRLAYRLQFALTVTLLDRHTRIIFYEWDNKPAGVYDESPNYRSSAAIQRLLPLPLTGRQFGTYYARGQQQADASIRPADQSLSVFAYTNVGRYYVLHFHDLFTDLTGRRGPNVLALSGTSYLEASTAFHVSRPQALLLPEKEAVESIRQSRFAFLPQRDSEGQPIRLSGMRQEDKQEVVHKLMVSLAGRNGRGPLGQELDELRRLGAEEPALWHDRQRLLLFVNSYDQAKWAANALRQQWPSLRPHIKHLVAGSKAKLVPGAIPRVDIEQFARTDGQILVAPLNAVGRGFNILNQASRAAFGAVYFLTRPYPHPHDVQAVAQEMNRRTFDWEADPDFSAWQEDGLQGKADAARRQSVNYWHLAESRSYYRTLRDDKALRAYPRRDLAATTVGYVIQAVGRLLRGGVPFHAFFVDVAWGDKCAEVTEDGKPQVETPSSSLLAGMIEVLTDYVAEDFISEKLYAPLSHALEHIENFDWEPDAPGKP